MQWHKWNIMGNTKYDWSAIQLGVHVLSHPHSPVFAQNELFKKKVKVHQSDLYNRSTVVYLRKLSAQSHLDH